MIILAVIMLQLGVLIGIGLMAMLRVSSRSDSDYVNCKNCFKCRYCNRCSNNYINKNDENIELNSK